MKTSCRIAILLIYSLMLVSPTRAFSIQDAFGPKVQKQIDSLNRIISQSSTDTAIASAYVGLAEILYVSDIDKLENLSIKAMEIADRNLAKSSTREIEKRAFRRSLAAALNNIGYVHDIKGDIPLALEYYNKAIKVLEVIGSKEGVASALNSMAYLYVNQGDSARALEFYQRSLKIEEEIGAKEKMASSLKSIGAIYGNQNDITLALEYYNRSLEMYKEINYQEGMASSLNNIGVIYSGQGDSTRALPNFRKSLAIKEELGDLEGAAYALSSIGNLYENLGEPEAALSYYTQALEIRKEIEDKHGISISLNNIGRLTLESGDVETAKAMAKQSLELANELAHPPIIRNASKLLSEVLKAEDNYEEALKMHELYIMMRDSVLKQEIEAAVLQKEAKHQIDAREAKIVLLDKENEIIKAQAANERIVLIGGAIGILALMLFLWRLSVKNASLSLAARTLKASNKTIGMQKDQAEENLEKQHDKTETLEEQIEQLKSPDSHLITLNSSGLILDVNKIFYIESQNRYVLITYHDRDKTDSIYERTSLKDFIQTLPTGFVQIHRSYVVNMAQIRSRASKYKLIMKDDELLPISESQVEAFDKALNPV
ncbi:MAG: LytTR family transcriptional regulator [Flavobacteriales bacterium]|nr:LytTR family transcriptional regulator [Flavobacteriales bacterium]